MGQGIHPERYVTYPTPDMGGILGQPRGDSAVTVDDRASAIGTVSGRIAAATPDALAAISAIDGVVAVEPEREIRLPRPGSGVQ